MTAFADEVRAMYEAPPVRAPGALIEGDPPAWGALERLALHEAGHAAAACALGFPVTRCTLEGERGGEVRIAMWPGLADAPRYVWFLAAGAVAEFVGWGAAGPGWIASDLPIAWATAENLLRGVGREPTSQTVHRLIDAAQSDAERLMRRHWRSVEAIAAALLASRTIDGARVLQLHHQARAA